MIALTRTGLLTKRFDQAVVFALDAHDQQRRKSTQIPYAAHLLGVASIVLEAGGSETEAIAALLHDVVEDQGGAATLAKVTAAFGPEVAEIVQECSAEDKSDGLSWRERKLRYLAGLDACRPSALLVSLADKAYNARSILADYRALGAKVWDRFNADEPKDESILWYYRALVVRYEARADDLPRQLLLDLAKTVDELARAAQRPSCPRCGGGEVTLITYGLPTSGDFEYAEDNEISLGGCIVDPGVSPDYQCRACGYSWADPDRWR